MVKPLKTVTAATRKVAGGDFSERIEAGDTYSELADLVESFNGMAEGLARMDASRSAFVANISHELKTPMTIISGFIDGILDHTIPPEDEARYLKIVSDETKRLSRLVVAMLNLSRIEAGKLQPVLSDVALDRLLLDTLVGFEMAVREKDIEITGLDALAGVTVQADETLFSQIIYNLIDNAVKFAESGSCITIRLYKDDGKAYVSVRDRGETIPPDDLPFIFDRFHKSDRSRSLDKSGVGLGLYLVKAIINSHDEDIAVESEDGVTEFVFTLPLAE
jgi:signal transduction histidine kinase